MQFVHILLLSCAFHALAASAQPVAAAPALDLHPQPGLARPLAWDEALLPTDLTIDEVRTLPPSAWRRAHPEQGRAMRLDADQALWARLSVAPHGALTPAPFALEFSRPGLDRVELYRLEGDELALQEVSGDGIPVVVWPVSGRYPAFEIVAAHWVPVTYFVRLRHHGPFTLQAGLRTSEDAMRLRWMDHLALGGILGALASIIGLCVVAAARSRRLVYGSLGVYGAALAGSLLATTGLLGEMMPREAGVLGQAAHALVVLTAAAGLVHVAIAISLWQLARRLACCLLLVAAAGVLLAGAESVLPWATADVDMVYLGVAGACALLAADVGRRHGDKWSGLQVASMLPLLVVLAFPIGESLGLVPVTQGALVATCVCALLHVAVQFHSVDAKVRTLLQARSRLQASQTTDPLTGIANYLGLLEREVAIRQRAGRDPVALLMIELSTARMEFLAAEGGYRRQEHAIVRAAELIRSCTRDIDLVARIDDAHFVVAMEAPVTLRDATDLASRILSKGLRAHAGPVQASALAFRIVVSTVPGQALALEELLAAAVRRLRCEAPANPRRIFVELPPQRVAA